MCPPLSGLCLQVSTAAAAAAAALRHTTQLRQHRTAAAAARPIPSCTRLNSRCMPGCLHTGRERGGEKNEDSTEKYPTASHTLIHTHRHRSRVETCHTRAKSTSRPSHTRITTQRRQRCAGKMHSALGADSGAVVGAQWQLANPQVAAWVCGPPRHTQLASRSTAKQIACHYSSRWHRCVGHAVSTAPHAKARHGHKACTHVCVCVCSCMHAQAT